MWGTVRVTVRVWMILRKLCGCGPHSRTVRVRLFPKLLANSVWATVGWWDSKMGYYLSGGHKSVKILTSPLWLTRYWLRVWVRSNWEATSYLQPTRVNTMGGYLFYTKIRTNLTKMPHGLLNLKHKLSFLVLKEDWPNFRTLHFRLLKANWKKFCTPHKKAWQ